MKKQLLAVEYDFDFHLIGMCCVSKDYRICYEINNKLGLILKKVDDIVFGSVFKKSGKDPELIPEEEGHGVRYSVYVHRHPQTGLIYNVVANKSEGNVLIPEKKECDYFLMITGEAHEKEKREALAKIKSIPMILTAFEIDPNKLRSKDHLILND
jgi:hypothetical protein